MQRVRAIVEALPEPKSGRTRFLVGTGLSGGAWQTIIIASLDERIAVAVPACG
jgi:hypothetical protein